MRENHENQPELTGIPVAAPVESAQVVEMSEVAALQAKVIELGLVRESRPVFVYDDKLAKEKSATTTRQAKYREKMNALGFAKVDVPRDLIQKVKENHDGDWSVFMESINKKADVPSLVVSPDVIKEVNEAGNIESWAQKRIEKAIAALPKPDPVIQKAPEKVLFQPSDEQKKLMKIGKSVENLTGLRAKFVRFLLDV